jgi:FAD dependent oxidoreductase TIGR03364
VVGAGLLGLAHALEARRRGLSVVLLDRSARATGASVRGSGHLFFSALESGPALEAASMARARWLELAEQAGTAADRAGTLILARNPEEMALLEAAAADPARKARIRSAKKIARLAPIPVDQIVGGLYAKGDLRIGPRSAPGALARLLGKDRHARVEWGAHVHAVEPGVVHSGRLQVRAQAIVVCPGVEYGTLPAELRPDGSGLTVRQAQMLRLSAPSGRRYRPTLTTGASLLEHAGLGALDAAARLRERLELEQPELVEHGLSLTVTQLANGELLAGSTIAYTGDPMPYSRERLDEVLLAQTSRLLGLEPRVRQRWANTHCTAGDDSGDFVTTRPMAGVRVVLGVRATAMALCHSHAGAVLEELLAGPNGTDMYITVRDMRSHAVTDTGVRAHPTVFGSRRPART